MGVKYNSTKATPFATHLNGSKEFRTPGPFNSLAKVERCPCEDGKSRSAFATAEPDTFWTIPACVYVRERGGSGKTVGGWLERREDGWRFVVNPAGKNAGLISRKA